MNNFDQYFEKVINTACINQSNNSEAIGPVEIVVPIFEGFKSVKKCIQALLQHTSNTHTITLLDDASSDIELLSFLTHITKQHQQIQLITRESNCGYLKNINMHLNKTTHAVVLLNSDTVVTSGWLNHLTVIAADSRIGVVCPLSNNATILSIPEIMPQQSSCLDELHGMWFPLPTAVGFCMLIKAGLWQQVNGFDPYYNPGYGEECDFSMEIRINGLQIACAPAALVFHQGAQSFKHQANELQQKHQHLLNLRWPLYPQEIVQFNNLNPIQWIRQWLLAKKTEQPRILHVVHGLDNKGGVELFTESLLQSFDNRYHHTVLIPKRDKNTSPSQVNKWPFEVIELNMGAYNPEHVIFNQPADLYHQQLDVYFKLLLQWANFSYVHFHSMVGIGTAIWPQICHQLDIPYGVFFHDHSGLCQIFSLSTTIDQQEIHCGKTHAVAKDQQCHQCIQSKTRKSRLKPQSFLNLREKIWQTTIEQANHLQFCSDYLFDLYQQKYKSLKHKSQVIHPCFFNSQNTPTKPIPTGKIKLAFLGQFGVIKGAEMFIKLYHHMSNDDTDWQIIGGVDPIYHNQLRQTDITLKGSYNSDELNDLLKFVDIIVFTAQIPETYGITLTEAMINGIPVVAPDLGAYSSRITNNGLLYQANNINSLVGAVKKLVETQLSPKPIKHIEYQAQTSSATTVLNQLYNSITKQVEYQNRSKLIGQSLIPPPKTSAYQTMQKWLEAPMTLEADADWRPAPVGQDVIIIGAHKNSVETTRVSLQHHLIDPKIHMATTASYQVLAEKKSILIIHAGTRINENIGNWLSNFDQRQAIVSSADYALQNRQQQIYAPQFMGSFSWQNLSINHANVGCLLLKPKSITGLVNQDFWSQNLTLLHLLNHLHQKHPSQLIHFPYISYTMADHQFANHWKQKHDRLFTQIKPLPDAIHILVTTHLTGKALSELKRQYSKQTWDENFSVQHHFFQSKNKSTLMQAIDFSDAAVFVMSDNIQLTDVNCLNTMVTCLYQSHVDALSISTARDVSDQYLVAKKAGSANHFQGIGRIKDLRFISPNAICEHDWLDDDFSLFSTQAWQNVVQVYQQDHSLFNALRLSGALLKNGLKIGIYANNDIYKKGLPSVNHSEPPPNLKKQRQALIDDGHHLPFTSHYPKAFSCQQGTQLDLNMASFKTPKNLPRVLAYAQDDWASGFYRVKSPLNALAADNLLSVHFLNTSNSQAVPTPYEIHRMEADVLLLHGFYSDQQLAALYQYKKQLKCKIIISIDDLLTDIPDYNPFAAKIPGDIKTRIKLACSLAHVLIVSTVELARLFEPYHPTIKVIPNRLSQFIWPTQPKVATFKERLRVGWAGAGQHQGDLDWLSQVVQQSKTFCDWVFFGDKPSATSENEIEYHPPVNLLRYPEKLNNLNINLGVAPLVDNRFNRAKSPLKLLEYGVLGLPVLASNLPCYHNSPATLLDNDVAQWLQQLKKYHSDRALLLQHGQDMLKWVHQGFWLEQHQNEWLNALGFSHAPN